MSINKRFCILDLMLVGMFVVFMVIGVNIIFWVFFL